MSPQRYERVNSHDDSEIAPPTPQSNPPVPSSPPPSFRSRASSPASRHLLSEDPLSTEAEQNLADTFDDGELSDGEEVVDDRQRLMRADPEMPNAVPEGSTTPRAPGIQRRVTELPAFTPPAGSRGPRPVNDGVFANLAAKPEKGEKLEELPPTYEQAAADATPPYWETTIVAPGGSTDDVYIDGMPVGTVFAFLWNGMIVLSFSVIGFLLAYLLHTTHAAKNGARAGLGLTLVQYGFYMKGSNPGNKEQDTGDPGQFANIPAPDPNAHDFNPDTVTDSASAAASTAASGGLAGIASSEWFSYILMIVGWFILIRAVSDFLRARRHEQIVLQSPDRGLPVPIIAEGERSETAV
ncbi:MAG: hypothetical protein Q9227_003981 [Pyrenula ochraceoflavens]